MDTRTPDRLPQAAARGRHRRLLLAAAFGTALLGGCTTTLRTENVLAGNGPGYGLLYNLPRAEFDVEARFLVTDCKANGKVAELRYELVGAAVQHRLAGDPAETYRLRYDLLNSPMKVTAASVVMHPNGMIKSVNVEQDDRSAQVMASLATTAINLFKAATVGIAPASIEKAKAECDPAIANRLKARSALLAKLPAARQGDEALDTDTTAAEDLAAKLQLATSRLAEAKKAGNASASAKLQDEVDSLTAKWTVANRKLSGRGKQAPQVQAALEKVTADLTATARRASWSPAAGTLCRAVEIEQLSFIRQFESSHGETINIRPEGGEVFAADVCVEGADDARKSPSAEAVPAAPGPDGQPQKASEKSFDGIVYRLPALAAVTVRSGTITLAGVTSVPVPQLGAKALLWLENKPFDQNAIQAAFNEDGSLSTLSFKAAARAERGAAAMADASKSLIDLMQLRADAAKAKAAAETEEQKREHQRQLDALDQQITLLGKRRALETARAPTVDPLDKEKERLSKQIDIEKLRQEYQALRKKADTP